MATTKLTAPGGQAAADFIQERFGIEWGPDVFGIAEDGFSADSDDNGGGMFRLTLIGKCTREDVERFVSLLWTKPAPADKENN